MSRKGAPRWRFSGCAGVREARCGCLCSSCPGTPSPFRFPAPCMLSCGHTDHKAAAPLCPPVVCDCSSSFTQVPHTQPPSSLPTQMLLLCLVLWPRLAPSGASACKLLPPNTPCPPTKLLIKPSAVTHADLAPTAAGLFDRAYLTRILQPLLSTTSSHPRLHSLWEHLLGFLIPGYHLKTSGQHHSEDAELLLPLAASTGVVASSNGSGAAAAASAGMNLGHLETMWGLVVEDGLMESSHERKYLGLALFQRLLPHVRAAHVPVLLSPGFCRTLLNSAKNPTTYLHASAKRCLVSHMGYDQLEGAWHRVLGL